MLLLLFLLLFRADAVRASAPAVAPAVVPPLVPAAQNPQATISIPTSTDTAAHSVYASAAESAGKEVVFEPSQAPAKVDEESQDDL